MSGVSGCFYDHLISPGTSLNVSMGQRSMLDAWVVEVVGGGSIVAIFFSFVNSAGRPTHSIASL